MSRLFRGPLSARCCPAARPLEPFRRASGTGPSAVELVGVALFLAVVVASVLLARRNVRFGSLKLDD